VSSNHLSWRRILILHKTCEQWGVANNFSKRKFWEHWIEKKHASIIMLIIKATNKKNNIIINAMDWINTVQLDIDKGKTKCLGLC
jgi:hypothetical protein